MLRVRLVDPNELAKRGQLINLCVKDLFEIKLGMSRTTFYNWNNNTDSRGSVRLYMIENLANALKTHPYELIEIVEGDENIQTEERTDADFNLIFPEEDDEAFIADRSEEDAYEYEVMLNYAQIKACMEKTRDDEAACGCTVDQVCSKEYLGVSRSTLYSWRTNPKRISLRYIERISNVFKIPPHDLITVTKKPIAESKQEG